MTGIQWVVIVKGKGKRMSDVKLLTQTAYELSRISGWTVWMRTSDRVVAEAVRDSLEIAVRNAAQNSPANS